MSQKVPPIIETKRSLYKLGDYNDDALKRSWYREKLQKISDNQYRIEKVWRRRTLPDGTKNIYLYSEKVGTKRTTCR